VEIMTMTTRRLHEDDGFTLIEVFAAMMLVVIGLMALAGAVAVGTRRLTGSQDQLIAAQRAAEAVESVFKARDNRTLTWAQIENVIAGGGGGIFLDGPRDMREPGADGIMNTADDGAIQEIIRPGPDGLLGTMDDERIPLTNFTREIEIREIRPNLRQLRVIVRYRTVGGPTQYIITTFISSYA
jgi:prepilin-type N-terminal cleavage/methylation domain-containing protein